MKTQYKSSKWENFPVSGNFCFMEEVKGFQCIITVEKRDDVYLVRGSCYRSDVTARFSTMISIKKYPGCMYYEVVKAVAEKINTRNRRFVSTYEYKGKQLSLFA